MVVKHNLPNHMPDEDRIEQPEATTPDEELELDLTPETPEEGQAPEKTYTQGEFKQVLARAKKAEDENKVLKTPKTSPVQPASTQPSVEEVVLLANGMSDEMLSQLKKIAAINNTSLIKAQTDPIFVAVKEKFEKDQKQKDASLPSSRGSGQTKPKVDFSTPNLPRETHKEMAMKALG